MLIAIGQGGMGFEQKEGRFRSDVRKKFFTLRAVRPQHCLEQPQAVDGPWAD